MPFPATSVLFGDSPLLTRRNYQTIHESSQRTNDDDNDDFTTSTATRPTGLAHWLFGFMYEDDLLEETDDDILYRSTIESTTHVWNPLNASLCLALLLSSAALSVPISLLGTVTVHLLNNSNNNNESTMDPSAFAMRATTAAVLGTSAGKFLLGPIPDVWGARRTAALSAMGLALSLVGLATAVTPRSVLWACFGAEFCYAIQWPCVVLTLATHYRGNGCGMYEGGIYASSLAARMGSLIGIPVSSMLVRHHVPWRVVALLGAWLALLSSAVAYLYVSDAPGAPDAPQNPIDPVQATVFFAKHYRRNKSSGGLLQRLVRWSHFIFATICYPSLKHVLCSGTFWLLSLAHTGPSLIRSSERILGTYLYDTSDGSLSSSRSSGLSVFLSVGIVMGLVTAGSIFGSRQERERKWLVSRLYVAAITSCYLLAFLSVPAVRHLMAAPDLVTTFQVMAIATAGFGIAVQYYHIPSLVCATFGCDKALAVSYVDGVACAVSAIVWRFVGETVHNGGPYGGGWAYGWAAVALFVLVTAILMVEFMEHYFCRPRQGGVYETIILA
jgi:MFS family permease